jgi:hypothetical protein
MSEKINEKDVVEFEAENGDVIEFEVVDYFLYDGEEYVILADLGQHPEKLKDHDTVDVFIMKVEIIDDENEEFLPIPAEIEDKVLEFAGKLLSGELPNEDEIL